MHPIIILFLHPTVGGEYEGRKTVNSRVTWIPDVMEWLKEEAEKQNRTLENGVSI